MRATRVKFGPDQDAYRASSVEEHQSAARRALRRLALVADRNRLKLALAMPADRAAVLAQTKAEIAAILTRIERAERATRQ